MQEWLAITSEPVFTHPQTKKASQAFSRRPRGSTLNFLNLKSGEITVELEELGILFGGINIIYFNEEDIVRYLTTDDNFDIRFVVNEHEFLISSDVYWLLENQFNFNFHKTSYKIHIY